jgi:Zn-dependent peptidase ImmA (M78 family)/transcriptional regulator with XRE-family HTH domain
MSPNTPLGANLQRLRTAKDLSQSDLAEKAGISRVAYRNIEAGGAIPRTATLSNLASALGVKIPDLMVPVRTLQAVRFRDKDKNRMNTRADLLVRVSRWLDDYDELETVLKDKQKFAFRVAKGTGSKTNLETLAAAARKAVGLKPDEPIRDICGLLEENGVKVFTLALASEGFFGLSVAQQDGGPAVVVNTWDRVPVERWIFTAAHELGHLLLHLDAYDVERRTEDSTEEKEADVFASWFLMPREVFQQEWEEARGLDFVARVLKLKHIFRVSYKTVLYRVGETTDLGKSVWPRFQAAYKVQHGRTLAITEEPQGLKASVFHSQMAEAHSADEPDRLSASGFAQDRLRRLVRDAMEKQLISMSRGAEMLGLSLLEMRRLVASWVS